MRRWPLNGWAVIADCPPNSARIRIDATRRQGFEAFVAIETDEVIHGSLPKKAARIVRQWALSHRAELMANWQRGVDLLPMEMIPGADLDD